MSGIHENIPLRIDRPHAGDPAAAPLALAPPGVNVLVKDRSRRNLDGLGQGPAGARRHRGRASGDGTLKPGQTVIEATSGNTGIGLAMVCAAKGYPLVVVMAENFSVERRKLMRFLGAKVVLTPAAQTRHRACWPRPTELGRDARLVPVRGSSRTRPIADMHSRTTRAGDPGGLRGRALDYFVTGCGTGGTPEGRRARAARRSGPTPRSSSCEPDNSPMLGSGIAAAAQRRTARRDQPSRALRPHRHAGLGARNFIPKPDARTRWR